MTNKNFVILLTFFTLILSGCQQKSSSKSSSTQNALVCTGQAYWTTPGCTGYCQYNPTACNGSTTGTTTGGTTGGTTGTTTGGGTLTGLCAMNPTAAYCSPTYCSVFPKPYGCLANGTNCFQNQTAAGCGGSSTVVATNPYWGVWYPGGIPAGTCASTYTPNGLTSAVETRKGTITLSSPGKESSLPNEYLPFGVDAPNYINTSPMLKSIAQAKMFFLTDSILKLRIKVNPEPDSPGTGSSVCYGRGSGAYLSGYTKLKYYVKVYEATSGNAAGALLAQLGPFTTSVNSCSAALDLSSYKESSPTGVFVTINDVQENKNCSPWNWNSEGWNNCSTFNKVRKMECWSMELEVAADGTKTFD